MNRNFVHPALAVAVAAFLATGSAVAQSTAPSATPPMAAPSGTSVGTPSTAPSMMAPATGTAKTSASQEALPGKTDSASAAFGKLSTKHQGYVTSDDVSKLQGFDFRSADKNSDGKLDQTEFDAAWSTYSGPKK